MERCSACGAGLVAGAQWCGQCFAPRPGTGTPYGVFSPQAAPARVERLTTQTRWGKTQTTFGPVGRVVASVALMIPLIAMGIGGLADPFAWGGAVVYLVAIVPWAMRDIWKRGQVVVR